MKIPKYFYFRVRSINKGTSVEVENASDVDVVEVVRCKDCKWWNSDEETCVEDGGLWRASDFCSWAERGENEAN